MDHLKVNKLENAFARIAWFYDDERTTGSRAHSRTTTVTFETDQVASASAIRHQACTGYHRATVLPGRGLR
jgi:hypothetical protein